MDADLLNVAKTLAERGWLPGIRLGTGIDGPTLLREPFSLYASEADLHLTTHNEIVRRGWVYQVDDGISTLVSGIDGCTYEPGTTTLSLLRCLLRACEAAEKENSNG